MKVFSNKELNTFDKSKLIEIVEVLQNHQNRKYNVGRNNKGAVLSETIVTTKPVNELLYLTECLESGHMFLDDYEIPRKNDDEEYSIVGRIQLLLDKVKTIYRKPRNY